MRRWVEIYTPLSLTFKLPNILGMSGRRGIRRWRSLWVRNWKILNPQLITTTRKSSGGPTSCVSKFNYGIQHFEQYVGYPSVIPHNNINKEGAWAFFDGTSQATPLIVRYEGFYIKWLNWSFPLLWFLLLGTWHNDIGIYILYYFKIL